MVPTRLLLAAAVLALLAAAPSAAARKPALVEGVVQDENGQPVPGVTVLVTSPDDPDLRLEETTDGEGKFRLEIADAGKGYLWSFQKEGHEPYLSPLEVTAGKRAEVTVTLPSDSSETARKRRAVKLYNDGVAAFNAQDLKVAAELFDQAAEADPSLIQIRIAQAEVALQAGDPGKALTAARSAAELEPAHADAHRLTLVAAQRTGDMETLFAAADALLGTELAANGAVTVYNAGVAALDAEATEMALRLFEKASELDPRLAAPYSATASLRYNRQDYDGALAALEKLLALEPGDSEALRLRYLTAEAKGDAALAAEARAAYEEAAPERAAAEGFERAEALFKADRLEESRALLEKILAADPKHQPARYTLGLCLLNLGDAAGARAELQRVVEQDPRSQQGRDAAEMLKFLQ